MTITPYYRKDADTGEWVSDTNLPTPSEIRRQWCYGLPLTKEDGQAMDDESIITFLKDAVAQVERYVGIYLKPTIIVSNPDERGLEEDVDYEVEEPPYDYDANAWMQYGFLQLRNRPVQQLNGFKLVLPNGNIILDFMTRTEWLKLYRTNGQVQIVPYAGDPTIFALMGGSQSGYPFLTGMMNANLPQMIYVDYVAGYKAGKIPNDIRSAVARIAAVTVLGIAGESLLAGVANMSTSIDGLSESFGTTASAENTTYGAHIYQYQKELKEFFDPKLGGVRSSERGITMTGL